MALIAAFELLFHTSKTKRLPLAMHVRYLRHLTPNLNQRKLQALVSLVNQKWLTAGQGNRYESPKSQSSILLISTTYKPGFGVAVAHHSGQNEKFWFFELATDPSTHRQFKSSPGALCSGVGQCLPPLALRTNPRGLGAAHKWKFWHEGKLTALATCSLANLCEQGKKGAVFTQLAAIHNHHWWQVQLLLRRESYCVY